MDETCEFRVIEEFAERVFRPHEGRVLGGWIRQVEISTKDPRFAEVGRLQEELTRTIGRSFYHGWHIRRRYTSQELAAAELLQLCFTTGFEPTGEECGTQYDESVACPYCGSGGQQTSDLHLDVGRLSRKRELTRTIADEVIVSQRLAQVLLQNGVGADLLGPVRTRKGSVSPEWSQLVTPPPILSAVPPTYAGTGPFGDPNSNESRCPVGHLLGLNMISELFVDRRTYDGSDLVATSQFVGVRRGLLRPRRILCLSQKLWRAVELEELKGIQIEVVHLT
jgi:hypothetical protein